MHGKQGSILVCLDNLPPGVSCKDLKDLMQRAVDRTTGACGQPTRFRFTSNVLHCTILRITNRATGETAYRGLATITPARCALAAIAELNQTDLQGARLQARRFRHRSFGQPDTTLGDLLLTDQKATEITTPYLLELVKTTAPEPLPAPAAPATGTAPSTPISRSPASPTAAPRVATAAAQAPVPASRAANLGVTADYPLFAH